MKRILILLLTLLCVSPIIAQNTLNDKADNIVGTYSGKQGNDRFKVKIVKLTDGTYRGQVIWIEHDKDAKGNKLKAKQDYTVSYNNKTHCWNDTKIYDPQRGIKANMTAEFSSDGRLRIKGSLFGISESVYWTKEK